MTTRRDDFDQLLQLIENLYEAALDETRWADIAPQIASAFKSTSTSLLTQHSSEPEVLSMTDTVAAAMGDYRAYYWQRDVWVQRATQLGVSKVWASKDVVADSAFQETEFYRDWCRPLDVFYVMGVVFPSGRNELGVLGIHRPRSAGTYSDEDKALAARFLPHLQTALRVRDQLKAAALQSSLATDALERCDTAIFLVSADGHLIFSNSLALPLFRNGGPFRTHAGRISTSTPSDTARLLSLIRSASNMGEAGNTPGGVMAIRQTRDLPLTVLVAPFRLTLPGLGNPSAIVFIRDPNRSISAINALRSLFQLTPAEARVAQALANGKSLAEIAALHRASPQTVRKQLKAIFAKTGTNRQAQCVAAILRGIAPIARD